MAGYSAVKPLDSIYDGNCLLESNALAKKNKIK